MVMNELTVCGKRPMKLQKMPVGSRVFSLAFYKRSWERSTVFKILHLLTSFPPFQAHKIKFKTIDIRR